MTEPARKKSLLGHDPTGGAVAQRANTAEAMVTDALRLVAMREHTLLSLSELSQELTISLDLFNLVDLVLFNLMGQLGTSRAAIWLVSEQGSGVPILVRSHGMNRPVAKALGSIWTTGVMDRLGKAQKPLPLEALEEVMDPAGARLVKQAEIAVLAPIVARGEVLGVLGLGPRVGGDAFGPVELGALQAALAMVGVAIQNMSYYNRLLENNRQLRLANEDLKNLDRLKSEFLQNVNHELRTPLTSIIAYVDCLLDPRIDGNHTGEFLKVVMEEALRLQGLLENLLAFSAVTDEKLSLSLTTGDVTVPLARYYQERLPGVSDGLRELVYAWDADVPPARYDEKRVIQIVDSLIDNAVKFTPEGSRIQLRARKAFLDGKLWACIEVEDDGPGIPRDRIPILFESFRQADGSSTRSVGGLGIGLALAKRLALAMDGQLNATSEIGRGSMFSVYLPAIWTRIESPPTAEQPPPAPSEAPDAQAL
jgi:signal transduction histidine kinase